MKYRKIGLQLKPVGSFCNVQCKYCYAEPFKTKRMNMMSEEVLTRALSELAHCSSEPVVSWHGGEPTLAGVDFFQKAMDIADTLQWQKPLVNQIQTNATLIDDKLAQLFAKYHFQVGISLDGPQDLHDISRVDKHGHPSFHKVMDGVAILRNNGVNPAITATVTKQHLGRAKELFGFLVDNGFDNIRLSPVFDVDENDFNISVEDWGNFLVEMFDLWFDFGDPRVHIRELDEVMSWMIGKPTSLCNGASRCANWISVDEYGALYPCEYFKTDYPYGNILQDTLDGVFASRSFRNHLLLFTSIPEKCATCEYSKFCGNGCPATRVSGGKMDPAGIDFYCESRKFIFSHISSTFSRYLEGGEYNGREEGFHS